MWLKAFHLKISQISYFKIRINMWSTVIFYLIWTRWGFCLFVGFFKIDSQLYSQLFSFTISKAYLSNYTWKSRWSFQWYRDVESFLSFIFRLFCKLWFVFTVLLTTCKYYRTLEVIFLNNRQNYSHSVDL